MHVCTSACASVVAVTRPCCDIEACWGVIQKDIAPSLLRSALIFLGAAVCLSDLTLPCRVISGGPDFDEQFYATVYQTTAIGAESNR